jgi:cytochrome c oxidase cbb3-type subunit III
LHSPVFWTGSWKRTRLFVVPVLFLVASSASRLVAAQAAAVSTQQAPPQNAAKPVNRGERLREFLGLGAAPDPVAAERGEKLYGTNCAFCHGAKATGGEGPDLVRSALVLHDEHGNLVGEVVSKGRPDKGMPAFTTFTPDQLRDIAEFLHMRIELAANRGLYKVQNVVTGNPQAGAAYFNGAGQCSSCHSPTGDLAHVGSRYQPADLQAQFLYPGSSARYDAGAPKAAAPKVTVTLPSGESVTGTLKRLDDFEVSVYDASGQYRSWSRDQVKVSVEDRLVAHRRLLDQYSDADMHNLLAYLVTLK